MDERILELRQAVLETAKLYQHARAVHAEATNSEPITEEMKQTARDCISAGVRHGAALMNFRDYLFVETLRGVENDEVVRLQKSIQMLEREAKAYERVLIS
jgi:hypothetical protein